MGACLADDMGLGKCVAPDTHIYINGCLNTAEKIWENYAGETQFDGEGFWAESTKQLIVNSINESTGKIIQAPIRRLYRQQVKEKLRKITLQDGSSITITRRHKLLTNQGWTNHLEIGDSVATPTNTGLTRLSQYWLVRDTIKKVITTFRISQSATATAIMREENLHRRTRLPYEKNIPVA